MKLDLGRTLLSTLDALEGLGLRYAIVGGLAVGAWGVSRSTRDVDVYAELPPDRKALERALSERGFHVPAMEEELERFGVFRSRSPDGVFVDVFPAVGPLGEAVLERRKSISFAGRPLWFIAPEELAILKAFSDRPRDFEDLVNLSAVVGPKLDVPYIQQWARRLDESLGGNEVTERVEKALKQSKPAQQQKKKRTRPSR